MITFSENIPSMILEGTPYNQGFILGQKLKKEVANNIATSHSLIEYVCANKKYLNFIQDNYSYLEEYFPELTEEIQGIAAGSGLPLQKVVELNIPVYFMGEYFQQECSMVLVRGNATH